jgi:quercetin dioxygenase-like cupin family protein
MTVRRRAAWLGLIFVLPLAACARPAGSGPARVESVESLLRNHPLPPGEAFKATEIHRSAGASYHLVQINTQEKPHIHKKHDLTGLMLTGSGMLFVDNTPFVLKAGGFFFVPRGAAHFFINNAPTGSAAWVTFTPPFDGKDAVPAP